MQFCTSVNSVFFVPIYIGVNFSVLNQMASKQICVKSQLLQNHTVTTVFKAGTKNIRTVIESIDKTHA